jgi:hypothetical protein
MPASATTDSSVRAMTSSTGAMPGRAFRGGPSQGGGLTTMALATGPLGGAGRSKKLMVHVTGMDRPASSYPAPALWPSFPLRAG